MTSTAIAIAIMQALSSNHLELLGVDSENEWETMQDGSRVRTNNVIGTRYNCFVDGLDKEKLSISTPELEDVADFNAKAVADLRANKKKAFVTFEGLTVDCYVNKTKRIIVTASAEKATLHKSE